MPTWSLAIVLLGMFLVGPGCGSEESKYEFEYHVDPDIGESSTYDNDAGTDDAGMDDAGTDDAGTDD